MPPLIIESGCLSPASIMAKDHSLLQEIKPGSDQPILHFYEWEGNCLTYGYFIQPADYLKLSEVKRVGLKMARRPTGGGLIFHLTDFAFSILIPSGHSSYSTSTLDNYAFVNQKVAQAIAHFKENQSLPNFYNEQVKCQGSCLPFCMAKPTIYDVMIENKKVGGAAQRRTKQGLLHQGSISLALPPIDLLESVLINSSELIASMQDQSYFLLEKGWTPSQMNEARQRLKENIIKAFSGL